MAIRYWVYRGGQHLALMREENGESKQQSMVLTGQMKTAEIERLEDLLDSLCIASDPQAVDRVMKLKKARRSHCVLCGKQIGTRPYEETEYGYKHLSCHTIPFNNPGC